MSNFWDSIIFPNKAEVVAVKKTDFWASILGGELVRPLPVKQSKPKAVKSTAKKGKAVVVAEAEKVYETIANLIVPSSECVHYWTIPTGSKWAIGVCKVCSGEKWFNNRFNEDGEYEFNDTLVPPKVDGMGKREEQSIADSLGTDYKTITTVYNSAQDSIEESE